MNLYIIYQKSRGTIFGVGTYIRELVAALKNSDIRIYLVNLLSDGSGVRKEEVDGVTRWNFPVPLSKQWNFLDKEQRALYFHNIVYLLRIYIQDRDDLVFHLNHYQNENFATELKTYFDCKVISVSHSSDWASGIHDNPHRLRSILNGKEDVWSEDIRYSFEEERTNYMKMDRIISLSNYMRDLLCQDYGIGPTKIAVIPNGLSDVMPQTLADREKLKRKWYISNEERIILFVGRMDDIKGGTFLVKAFQKVLENYPGSRLVIVGNGNYDSFLREAKNIQTKITFTGLLDRSDLYELYRLADVGVVPSLFEPFGYVPVEMMMHELPIVATATSGLNEVVDESCGLKVPLIVSPDNVEIDTSLLAQKIIYLLQNPKEAKRLGKNGRKRYLEKYSSEVFGKNMIAFYKSLFQECK
ncbi:TIGR04157 family glycosyltransferase [Parabacteroides distasonis]|jgi:glycosyltransferase|uniref:TIGR04157 family glycosyltransferase n=1 Tax=Parabacteroides distasonis TaxID=823 RepID=UPI000EFBB1EF|nr:TIGR04157 family glycosyltransferase [Parabacteroides distasonis]RGT94549.1 TIGR04157 family glycosyltransferase [Parabacteroides distasonis]